MDADKIKNFFIQHIEKMILGIIVCVSGYLIYQGTTLPNFLLEKQPEELTEEANTVRLGIDEDHNETVVDVRRPAGPSADIVARTKDLYKPVDPTTYKLPNTWIGETGPDLSVRRNDPVLVAPIDLRTASVICTIAANGARNPGGYLLAESLENAGPIEAEEETRRPRGRSPRRSSRRGGSPMEESMEDPMMGAMGVPAGPEADMAEAIVESRQFDRTLDLGTTLAATTAGQANYPQPKLGWFIAGTALLPHREIYEAYELALRDAGNYDPERDTPLYFDFEVQRADVTGKSVDQLAEADWSKAYDRILYTRIADKVWNGFAPELVPADYRDDNITIWIPPVLLDDYGDFALHPRIPKLTQEQLQMQEMQEMQEAHANAPVKAVDDIGNFDFENSNAELAVPGGVGDVSPPGNGGTDGFDGGMAMVGRGKLEADPVDYKLMRFYDFGAYPKFIEPGRSYSYRLRYAVIDPNFPADPRSQPPSSKLTSEVAQRVSAKMAEALKTGKRNFRFWSEWSEPTSPASLPPMQETFAGSVEPGPIKVLEVSGREIPVNRDVATAELLWSQFDDKLGVRVPVLIKEIHEGNVLARDSVSADLIDPISGIIKKKEGYKVSSSTIVVDLGGSTPLKISEGLTSPSEMLLFDSHGNLIYADDVSDQRDFRVYSFAKERRK